MKQTLVFILFVFLGIPVFAQNNAQIKLWPGKVPGEKEMKCPAKIYPGKNDGVIRLTDITDPLVTVYKPSSKPNLNAAVIICPGGGNKYLAINLEGTDEAKWLNKNGITAFVLQYRVPNNRAGALQDIQRAIRVIKKKAGGLNIDANKIGVMGFSAGGNLAARAATEFNTRSYVPIDKIDSLSCRPDFAILLYPGSLSTGPEHVLIPELKTAVNKNSSPTFIAVANDDPIGLPLSLAYALHYAKVPLELHVFPKGGHGFGMKKGNPAAEAWPTLALNWMKNILKNADGKK